MEGFFTKKETQSKSRPDGKVYSCVSCGLYQNVRSPKMLPYGRGKKHILIIGEAPGEVEDRKGMPWQGKTGRLLQKTLSSLGIDLFEDCLSINAVNCRPQDNRYPTQYEIDCCRTVLLSETIDDFSPKLIILLGNAALVSFLGHRWKKDLGGISKWRGWLIPDRDFRCWVLPTFHPSYVERGEFDVMTIWKNDLLRAIEGANSDFPTPLVPNIEYIKDLRILERLQNSSQLAFDYETTGLKPHASGHRIVCASVATHSVVYTFLMPKTKLERKPFTDLLEQGNIGKMAHNMKFENIWTETRLRIKVNNWEWDSMIAAHILDNRSGITSLKFQVYVNFGIIDYASEVTPYLQGIKKGGNALNRIDKLLDKPGGRKMLLKYCALDSFYEYHLAIKQMTEMDYDFLPF